MHAMRTWRMYLEGVHCRVSLITSPTPSFLCRLSRCRGARRWAEYLSRFDMEWEYKPGRVNVADPLSRAPTMATWCGADSQSEPEQLRLVVQQRCSVYVAAPPVEQRTVVVLPPPPPQPAVLPSPPPQAAALSDADMPHEVTLAEANVLVRDFQAGYGADSWFADASNIAELQLRGGLYFRRDGQVCVPDSCDLRQRIIRKPTISLWLVTFGHVKTLELIQKGLLVAAYGSGGRALVQNLPELPAQQDRWAQACWADETSGGARVSLGKCHDGLHLPAAENADRL